MHPMPTVARHPDGRGCDRRAKRAGSSVSAAAYVAAGGPKPHVTVCICTYRRPQLLQKLLEAVDGQHTEGCFSVSIVIVDNDSAQSAEPVVQRFATTSKTPSRYLVEPVQNIALARNRAVGAAGGEYVALIDDDEHPDPGWLLALFRALLRHDADGALGPVLPDYDTPPPRWVLEGQLCERERFPSGTMLRNPRYTRTSNVLLARTLLKSAAPFDPRFGLTGGEDSDFFRRLLRDGCRLVWSDEACVHERVPPERLLAGYFVRRALLRGVANAQQSALLSVGAGKSVLAIGCYLLTLPVAAVLGRHRFMRVLLPLCDHLGKVLALCGVRIVSRRTF
jgi:glycosyltransferase involved in cell wall biosynthesis